MSIIWWLLVIIFSLLMECRSVLRYSFVLEIPCFSESLMRLKSIIMFSDCLFASRRLFCIVRLPLPIGDLSSHLIFVFMTYKSGFLLCLVFRKITSLLKWFAKILAAHFSCGRGFDVQLSSIWTSYLFGILFILAWWLTNSKLKR